MMKAKFLLFLTLSFVLAACTDKAYDLDKLSREMTFFENEISIPVGSLGPITAESLLGDILKSLELETSRDGYLLAHSTEDFFELSAYELALKAPDPSQPFVYDCGSVSYSVEGAAAIDTLKTGDRVLVAEACTHVPDTEDIGRVKIPALLRRKADVIVDVAAGDDFPEDLSPYALVIHCGACVATSRLVRARTRKALLAGVPITNYGIALAKLKGILERVRIPRPEA